MRRAGAQELDVWVECSPENARRSIDVLAEFGFADLGVTEADFTTPDLVIQLGYEPNRVDLLTGLSGVRFEDAYPRRITGTIDCESLAANRRAFGRAIDLADAEELEK